MITFPSHQNWTSKKFTENFNKKPEKKRRFTVIFRRKKDAIPADVWYNGIL